MPDECRSVEKKGLLWHDYAPAEKIVETPVFTMNRVFRNDDDGHKGDFVTLDAPDWVIVLPIINDEKGEERYVMVEQYRHGSCRLALEFPAGVVEQGEDAAVTAARELREETGFTAHSLTLVGEVNTNAAFLGNTTSLYKAIIEDPIAQRQNLDKNERIKVHVKSAGEIETMIGTPALNGAVHLLVYLWHKRDSSTS